MMDSGLTAEDRKAINALADLMDYASREIAELETAQPELSAAVEKVLRISQALLEATATQGQRGRAAPQSASDLS